MKDKRRTQWTLFNNTTSIDASMPLYSDDQSVTKYAGYLIINTVLVSTLELSIVDNLSGLISALAALPTLRE